MFGTIEKLAQEVGTYNCSDFKGKHSGTVEARVFVLRD